MCIANHNIYTLCVDGEQPISTKSRQNESRKNTTSATSTILIAHLFVHVQSITIIIIIIRVFI